MNSTSYLKVVKIPDKCGIDIVLYDDAEVLRQIASIEGILSVLRKLKDKNALDILDFSENNITELEFIIADISKRKEGIKFKKLLQDLEDSIV